MVRMKRVSMVVPIFHLEHVGDQLVDKIHHHFISSIVGYVWVVMTGHKPICVTLSDCCTPNRIVA